MLFIFKFYLWLWQHEAKLNVDTKPMVICVIFNGKLINMYRLIKEPNKGNKYTLHYEAINDLIKY